MRACAPTCSRTCASGRSTEHARAVFAIVISICITLLKTLPEPLCAALRRGDSSHAAVLNLQVQGDDNILDLVKLVKPAALIPLMNAEIESSGA